MSGLLTAEVIGNLGVTPELRETKGGTKVVNMRVCANVRGGGAGEAEVARWVTVVAFGKLAEVCVKHLAKGRQVYASGRLQWREYDGKTGRQTDIEIIADTVQFLGGGMAPANDDSHVPF